ncbi:sulfotransferase [Rheinheimera sp.]|uniref:tetratricopeptide repeat-containing sulfotransferase family protein n=1 Tax=Rheinheimera sp. TaxID=1869214 RepID=UPI00307EC53D
MSDPTQDALLQARQLIQQQQGQAAYQLLATLVRQQPAVADSYFLMAQIQLQHQQLHKAKALLVQALKLRNEPEFRVLLIQVCSLLAQMADVQLLIKPLQPAGLSQAGWADTLGVALTRLGDHQAALGYFARAVALAPQQDAYQYNYGVALKFCGDFAAASQALQQAIHYNSKHSSAWYALSELQTTAQASTAIPRLRQLLSQQTDPDQRLIASHALARYQEAEGAFADALLTLEHAKQVKKQTTPTAASDLLQLFPALTQLAEQASSPAGGSSSQEPVFIIGMPRSGTTLVERILSSHSQVQSAGELQDFATAVKELTQSPGQTVLDPATLAAAYQLDPAAIAGRYLQRSRVLTGSKPHFIDKLPFNFFYVDLLRRAFPQAKIIWMLRNPADTCLGNYRALFSLHNPYYSYVFDLKDTAAFYAGFYRWTEFWQQQQLPQIRFQSYEQLVRQPDQQTHALLQFCGLSAEPGCFISERNTSPVATASKVQVREAIHTKAIGRWARYQPAIDPLLQALEQHQLPFEWPEF